MAVMPGVDWRPVPEHGGAMHAHDIICIHTMVGSLWGTDAYFRKPNPQANSHFGTGPDGHIIQWVDTSNQSWANLNGNGRVISIENADMGAPFPNWSGSDVPPFTDAQVEAIAKIIAWACRTYGIPCELIPDSKPGRRGVGYHRQGIDGSYPDHRVTGGELWSRSAGKVCPGDRRVAQMRRIVDRARQLLGQAPSGGGSTPPPAPSGAPGKFGWNLPAGHYYGNVAGPTASHGGYYASERDEVRNIQQWLIYHGCVAGVPASAWATSGWADGKWEGPTDTACRVWHDRFYPGQPYPTQVWRDDYDRLARA